MDIVGKDIEREIYKWVKCLDETTIWKRQVRDIRRVIHERLITPYDNDNNYKVIVTTGTSGQAGYFKYEIYRWNEGRLHFSHSDSYFATRFYMIDWYFQDCRVIMSE